MASSSRLTGAPCTAPATTSADSRGTSPATAASCGRSVVARPFVPDDGDTLPRGLALSPDGRTLALGHSDGTVDFLDAQTLRRRRSLRALRGFVAAIAYSPRRAPARGRGPARTGDALGCPFAAIGGRAEGVADRRADARVLARRRSARRRRIRHTVIAEEASGQTGGRVQVWDIRSRAPTTARFETASPALTFSPDGRLIAVAAMSHPTEIRDANSGRLVATLPAPDFGRSVAFSPDGTLLATGHYDGTGQLWSTESWKPVGRPLEGHAQRLIISMEFTPDGAMLASAGQDGAVTLWDVEDAEPDRSVAARRARQLHRRRPLARRLAPVRSLPEPASRPLGRLARGLEAARLPRRGARTHTTGMGRRATRPALPNRLPARLKAADKQQPTEEVDPARPTLLTHARSREARRRDGRLRHISQAPPAADARGAASPGCARRRCV